MKDAGKKSRFRILDGGDNGEPEMYVRSPRELARLAKKHQEIIDGVESRLVPGPDDEERKITDLRTEQATAQEEDTIEETCERVKTALEDPARYFRDEQERYSPDRETDNTTQETVAKAQAYQSKDAREYKRRLESLIGERRYIQTNIERTKQAIDIYDQQLAKIEKEQEKVKKNAPDALVDIIQRKNETEQYRFENSKELERLTRLKETKDAQLIEESERILQLIQ